MASELKKHRETLIVLAKARPNLIKRIIETGPKSLIDCLSECALNVLQGNLKINQLQKKKLSRFKNKLRLLASKRAPLVQKKKALQTGGFVGLLASLVTPLIVSGIKALVNRKKKNKKKNGKKAGTH